MAKRSSCERPRPAVASPNIHDLEDREFVCPHCRVPMGPESKQNRLLGLSMAIRVVRKAGYDLPDGEHGILLACTACGHDSPLPDWITHPMIEGSVTPATEGGPFTGKIKIKVRAFV